MWRFLSLDRTPEPEVMADEDEAFAYESQTAERYLSDSDNRFVARILACDPLRVVVDLGTGPGQIPVCLAKARPSLKVFGCDLSDAMLTLARRNASTAGVSERVQFLHANAAEVPLPAQCADAVICNSTLHHFADPVAVFNEAARLLRPGGVALIRDLRRPSRPICALHIALFGRHYRGKMREMFGISVRAAYTVPELRALMAKSRLADGRVSREDMVHLLAVAHGPHTSKPAAVSAAS